MATKKYTIDDFKDRLDSPFAAGGWDIEKKPAKKKTVKKSAPKKGKSNAKGK